MIYISWSDEPETLIRSRLHTVRILQLLIALQHFFQARCVHGRLARGMVAEGVSDQTSLLTFHTWSYHFIAAVHQRRNFLRH